MTDSPPINCAHDALVTVAELKPNPENPNKHPKEQLELYAKILLHQGWRKAICVSNQTGLIVTGHGAWLTAKSQGWTSVPVDFQDFANRADEIAHMIADNKLPQMAEFDDEALAKVIKEDLDGELGLDLTGLSVDELVDLKVVEPEPVADAEPQIDQIAELQKKWKTARGQLWELGEHRLLCGDSTNAEDVARVDVGDCSALVFDPEWNAIPAMQRVTLASTLAFTDAQHCGEMVDRFGKPAWVFVWDCGSCWFTPSRPLKKCKLCLWFGDVKTYNMDGAHYGDAGEMREVFNSRGSYIFKPDPRGKHLADIFAQPITQTHANGEHSHSKPLDWIRMLIGNCTTGCVYDPFSGSGTTLIACEQLGRRCRAIEIDRGYVAVALQRWADATSKTPVLLP
jgi:hypothetical protein